MDSTDCEKRRKHNMTQSIFQRIFSWPLASLGLIVVAIVILALPAQMEGPALVDISPGHAISVVDALGLAPLLLGTCSLHAGLWRRRHSLAALIRGNPGSAAIAIFAAGVGLGMLLASAFSSFFWWWAIGAVLFATMNVITVVVVSRAEG